MKKPPQSSLCGGFLLQKQEQNDGNAGEADCEENKTVIKSDMYDFCEQADLSAEHSKGAIV